MPPIDPCLDSLRRHTPAPALLAEGDVAAVALLLRDAPDPELLLIRRSVRPGDPWSGHMAFPGGRRGPGDADARATAIRETREEVGIDLVRVGGAVAEMDPVAPLGGAFRLTVHAFVWSVPAATSTRLNHEVDCAFWIPLPELLDPAAAAEFRHQPSTRRFPALRCRGEIVWGLTYRVLGQLLALVGDRSLPR